MTDTKQPNILMIMADQLSALFTEPYGHRVVRTPHMRQLAERGVVFERAYCNNPLCAPSRASMMTGCYSHRIGAYDNGTDFSSTVPTFAHVLHSAGYHTMLSGKMHFLGPDQLHGFRERLTTDIYPAGFHWTPQWELWQDGVTLSRGSNVSVVKHSGPCLSNMQTEHDDEVHNRGMEALRREARKLRSGDRTPFFLCASYTQPHDPFVAERKWWDLYDGAEIDPPSVPDERDRHPYNEWLQTYHGVTQFPLSEDDIVRARRGYYAMVSDIDARIGSWVAELKRLGLYDNTVIIVTSDHGEMLGEHGMWFKRTYFEHAVRVPLILAWEGQWQAGKRCGSIVSLIDLFPTLCDIAGADRSTWNALRIDGQSLVPLAAGEEEDGRYALVEYTGEGVRKPMRMIRKGKWKLVMVRGHDPVLYDLEANPQETINVFEAFSESDLIQELWAALRQGWDDAEIERHVVLSQRRRNVVNAAGMDRQYLSWNYVSQPDVPRKYVYRNTQQESMDSRL